MIISSLELADFRNIEKLSVSFSEGTNIFYGDNAQGKTNILEALFLIATTKSHRGVRDRDLIRFGREEAHIRAVIMKKGIDHRIDMHLRAGRSKGIAINGQRIRKASELIGLLHIVFFSPEDLAIVKSGPAERRRFMDLELCQLQAAYLHDLNQYNRVVEQRNRLLRDDAPGGAAQITLDILDEQLVDYGTRIITERKKFIESLNDVIGGVHAKLTAGSEALTIAYEPDVAAEDLAEKLRRGRRADLARHVTGTGPHRDDFSFISNGIDLRRFGSQGQQRTCALSLKLSEIEIVRSLTGDTPVLMLDDVLSELDGKRQNDLLDTIGSLQTFITCTGLDDLVGHRSAVDKVYRVAGGKLEDAEGAAQNAGTADSLPLEAAAGGKLGER